MAPHREGVDATIRNPGTFHESYSLQFRQAGELRHAVIREHGAACEINVPNAITALRQCLDRWICNSAAVAKMDVMQVLAQLGDGEDGSVSDLSTLGQDEISKSWASLNDLLHPLVAEFVAICQIQYPQRIEGTGQIGVMGNVEKRGIGDSTAMC